MRGTASDDVVFARGRGAHRMHCSGSMARPFPAMVLAGRPSAARPSSSASPRPRAMPPSPFAQERRPIGMTGRSPSCKRSSTASRPSSSELLPARTLLYATTEWWIARPQERDAMAWRLAAAKYTVTDARHPRHRRGAARRGIGRSWPPPRHCSATSATPAPPSASRRSTTWPSPPSAKPRSVSGHSTGHSSPSSSPDAGLRNGRQR